MARGSGGQSEELPAMLHQVRGQFMAVCQQLPHKNVCKIVCKWQFLANECRQDKDGGREGRRGGWGGRRGKWYAGMLSET